MRFNTPSDYMDEFPLIKEIENACWFYLITYYLFKNGYEIKEFPSIIARPPVDPTDFTYGDIRNRTIAQGDDDAIRRAFVASLTFEQKDD